MNTAFQQADLDYTNVKGFSLGQEYCGAPALRSQFDRVIIDAPSAAPLADVGILTPLVDSVLLVVHAGTTTKPAIQEAVTAIGPSKLLGVVLNGAAA